MNSSNMKYIPLSSPHTHSMNNIHVPPKILVPPVFQPASWERERSSSSSLEDSQESNPESLEKERQYQLELQQRILENQKMMGQDPGDTLEDDSLEEDSLEEMSSEEEAAEYDPNKKGKPKVYGSGRKMLPVDKYSNLRYSPHWKSAKKGAKFLKAEKASQISAGSSGDFSVDSFYLHSDDSSENNQEAKTQDSLPEFDPELFSFYGANVASNESVGPHTKRKELADGFHSKNNPGRAFPPQNQQDPPQRAKKNFVKKNKRTLGLQSEKNSYLELHNRKQVLQGQNFYPAEVLNPEHPSNEKKKFQPGSPSGIPHQPPANAIPGHHFSRNNSTSGQAHPELGNISSDFNAIFQERVKDQAPLQDFKNHIHEDNSSPTASCRTSHVKEKMKQHQPRISDFGDDFADMWFWGFLPPPLPQVQRGSQGNSGRAEGNPRKMRRSSSEGSLLQMEKQKQPKASKKKEKLKLQKEYSRQINEYNMKNITVVQRLPAKAQVSSVSRQKALEYAKKIPRPKTFISRPPEQEVKEVLPRAQTGTSLPQIPTLESLWNRHKKEKEVVAAFKSLHIF
ncbi:jhy protein homolog isoform 2-T2 [Acridotheres tristis]